MHCYVTIFRHCNQSINGRCSRTRFVCVQYRTGKFFSSWWIEKCTILVTLATEMVTFALECWKDSRLQNLNRRCRFYKSPDEISSFVQTKNGFWTNLFALSHMAILVEEMSAAVQSTLMVFCMGKVSFSKKTFQKLPKLGKSSLFNHFLVSKTINWEKSCSLVSVWVISLRVLASSVSAQIVMN